MLADYISNLIKQELVHVPTAGQEKLILGLAKFVLDPAAKEILVIKGYAGTGKTSAVSALVRTLEKVKHKSVLLAPTGRAAKVFSSYSGKNAYTIHKKIYRQRASRDGFGEFALDKNLHTDTLFIVDEASMISNESYDVSIFGSGRLLDDLIKYVYEGANCRLILVGDTAQLPPVHYEVSPALDKNVLEGYSFRVQEICLTEIVRQSEGSGILHNATLIRNLITKKDTSFPKLQLGGFTDVVNISGNELIEELTNSYDRIGREQTIVVCRSNKTANKYNKGIRNTILGREEEISPGDFLMVVKNNYFWLKENEQVSFIANGDIMEIVRIHKFEEIYGYRFADLTLRFSDYDQMDIDAKIMLDTLYVETASLGSEENKKFYYAVLEDYMDKKSKKERYDAVKTNPYFNALQVKFAYAVTCHKAQGGQWNTVFADTGYVEETSITIEYLRWLYTAFTGPVKKLFLVNFNKKFFE